MKKLLAVLLTVTLCLSCASVLAEPITLKLAEQMPEGHVMVQCLHHLADKIQELSKGEIICEVYSGGVLGDDTAHQEALQMGAVDIIRNEFTTMVNFGAKKAVVTTLPYVFRDRTHYWAFADSAVGKELLDSVQADGTGMVALGYLEEGSRHFFTTKPVKTMADLKGMKLRVQNTDMWLAIVKALGASPTPMSFSEVYQALSTGVVDGAEQPLSGYVSQKFYEVSPNMILDGHVYPVQAYTFSEVNWKKLTPEQQAIILEAVKDTSAYCRTIVETAEADIMKQFTELGVAVAEVPDKTEWVDAMKPVYEQFATPEVLEMLTKIQAL